MFGHTRLLYLHFGANQVPSADSGRFCREKLRRGGDFSAVQALWMGLTIDGAHSIISPVHALVAQLDRASDSDSEGRTFESCRAHQSSPRYATACGGFFVASEMAQRQARKSQKKQAAWSRLPASAPLPVCFAWKLSFTFRPQRANDSSCPASPAFRRCRRDSADTARSFPRPAR